jgi:hypothetical protein
MVIRHDVGVDKVAERKNLGAYGSDAGRIIIAHDTGAIPVLADAHGDVVWLDGCPEVGQRLEEGLVGGTAVLVANGLGAEFRAVEDIGRQLAVFAVREDLQDRGLGELPAVVLFSVSQPDPYAMVLCLYTASPFNGQATCKTTAMLFVTPALSNDSQILVV